MTALAEFCDRCGRLDISVAVFNDCEECGPVPLCSECRRVHVDEIAAERAYDLARAVSGEQP